MSNKYDKILQINYTLHQICTSSFVTDDWLHYLRKINSSEAVYLYDLRATGPHIFKSLDMLCKLINQTITDNLIRFYSTEYVTGSVIPYHLFELHTQTFTEQFRSSLTTSFLLSMTTIRNATQINNLASVLPGNFEVREPDLNDNFKSYPVFYSDCSCHLSATCKAPLSIYDSVLRRDVFTIPNFYIGCYPIEALLQSTLQCFYNQSCIQQIQFHLPQHPFIVVQPLDSSLPTNYFENSTVHDLVENLMIEQWNLLLMYESYYSECAPAKCMYSYETRNDIIYLVTTVFGLVGGLVTVLKFVVSRLIHFIFYCIRKWKIRVLEVTPSDDS